MPPKKGGGKTAGEPDPRADPETFLKQYKQFCKVTNISPWEQIEAAFSDDDEANPGGWKKEFVIFPKDPHDLDEPRLGPGGCRALCTSILGTQSGLTDPLEKGKPWPQWENGAGKVLAGGAKSPPNFMVTPFIDVKSMRIWWSRIGDDGAAAIAELLRLGGAEVAISFLELWDNEIGPSGCLALGKSLAIGWNRSLLNLKLDYNTRIGSDGVAALCRGLRTNLTLRQLHLPYCKIDERGAAALADMLSADKRNPNDGSPAGLTFLNLQGNRLGDQGLQNLSRGLALNKALVKLNLADNMIGTNPDDLAAVKEFADALMVTGPVLEDVSLNYNHLAVPAVTDILTECLKPKDRSDPEGIKRGQNPRIKKFEVDTDLPGEVYDLLNFTISGKGGKKGKKAGKKKK
jgi:hypothetical protein